MFHVTNQLLLFLLIAEKSVELTKNNVIFENSPTFIDSWQEVSVNLCLRGFSESSSIGTQPADLACSAPPLRRHHSLQCPQALPPPKGHISTRHMQPVQGL